MVTTHTTPNSAHREANTHSLGESRDAVTFEHITGLFGATKCYNWMFRTATKLQQREWKTWKENPKPWRQSGQTLPNQTWTMHWPLNFRTDVTKSSWVTSTSITFKIEASCLFQYWSSICFPKHTFSTCGNYCLEASENLKSELGTQYCNTLLKWM